MRILVFAICLTPLFHFACQNKNVSSAAWPGDEDLALTWQLTDDAAEGDDKRTATFTLTNHGSVPLPAEGWALYFSQFPLPLYFPMGSEDKYEMNNIGGDLYEIKPLQAFEPLEPDSSVTITYQSNFRFIKSSHAPRGPYILRLDQDNPSLINVDYEILEHPADMTFNSASEVKKVHISAEDRYASQQAVSLLDRENMGNITPAPFQTYYRGSTYTFSYNLTIRYDAGLEDEADYLALQLNKVQQNPVRILSSEEEGVAQLELELDPGLMINGTNESVYTLDIARGNPIKITGSDAAGVYYGIESLRALFPVGNLRVKSDPLTIPALQIRDAPRFKYRGLHIDIARNFSDVQQLIKVVRLMGFYKLNKLHLHLTDDEGWRLEIPGLPELTTYGVRKGPLEEGLPPAYGSGSGSNPAGSGYLTRDEYIQLVKEADRHHIEVIPEINGPGHARAAIRAMKKRYELAMEAGNENEARDYQLHDPNDKSQYISAQNYTDNVICVCLESPYTFLDKVVGEVVRMHEEANVPLKMIHMGGDEVPAGSWMGSPECERLMSDEPLIDDQRDIFKYFILRYQEIASRYNLQLAGWEEIVMHEEESDGLMHMAPDPSLTDKNIIPYVWNSTLGGGHEDMAYKMANMGYQVVLCNSSNLYFDMAYDYDPAEDGLYWSGFVDTRNAFEFTPFNILSSVLYDDEGSPVDGLAIAREKTALEKEAQGNILGIQGEMWSETIWNNERQEYMLLPKMLALAERAWSPAPDWAESSTRNQVENQLDRSWNEFANRLGQIELPRLDYLEDGYGYRLPPPGAVIQDGKLYANAGFPGLALRYTLDGSDPTQSSALYQKPIDLEAGQLVKIATFSTTGRHSRIMTIVSESFEK